MKPEDRKRLKQHIEMIVEHKEPTQKGHKRGDWRKLVAMMLENSLFMQLGDYTGDSDHEHDDRIL